MWLSDLIPSQPRVTRCCRCKVLVRAYGPDAVRYYFAKEVEFGRDGDFAEERFRAIVNADLANTVGNLLNRTLGLLKKNCGGAVPGDAAAIPPEHPLRSFAAEQVREVPNADLYSSASTAEDGGSPPCVYED